MFHVKGAEDTMLLSLSILTAGGLVHFIDVSYLLSFGGVPNECLHFRDGDMSLRVVKRLAGGSPQPCGTRKLAPHPVRLPFLPILFPLATSRCKCLCDVSLGPRWPQNMSCEYFVQYLFISEVAQIQIGHWPLTSVSPKGGLAEQPEAFIPEEFKSQSISVPHGRNKHRPLSQLWELITYTILLGAHRPSDSWQINKDFSSITLFGFQLY